MVWKRRVAIMICTNRILKEVQCAEVDRDWNHCSLCIMISSFVCVCSGFSLAVILPTTTWFQRTSRHSETPSRNCRYLLDSSCMSFLVSCILPASPGFILPRNVSLTQWYFRHSVWISQLPLKAVQMMTTMRTMTDETWNGNSFKFHNDCTRPMKFSFILGLSGYL